MGESPSGVVTIEEGTVEDIGDVLTLLESTGLPQAGLDAQVQLIVARQDGGVCGSAALEEYAGGALLRSVAVHPRSQGHGIGHRLTKAALALARRRGHRNIYLLTTTAARFFPEFGFAPIARDEVPDDVRSSVEFTSACPATAVAMRAPIESPSS